MPLESNSNSPERGTFSSSGRHKTLVHVRNVLVASAPKNLQQKRWERRWTAASGAWLAVLLALAFGGTDWRTALMVSATAFMLGRGGDILDDY